MLVKPGLTLLFSFALMSCSWQKSINTEQSDHKIQSKSHEVIPTKPSILFINIDDLNNWNSVLKGHPQSVTPNLERLAKKGITFSRTIAPSPVCFPSRTALFSGLHPTTTGAISNFNWGKTWRFYLQDTVTIPKHFEAQGWTTVGAGKNFHNKDKTEFQVYHSRPKEPKTIANTGYRKGALGWAEIEGDVTDMPDYKVVTKAIDAINQYKGPLFLSVGIYRPHVPWNLPKAYFDRFPLDSFRSPDIQQNDLTDLDERYKVLAHNAAKFDEQFHHNLANLGQDKAFARAYLASVSFADDQLGRLLDAWYASSHASNSYIVLWSDHGFMLGEKQGWGKFKPWWDSSQANLIVSGGAIEWDRINASPISLIDIYPTLIDLMDIAAPSHKLEGRSIKPLLDNPNVTWQEPVTLSHEEDGIRYDVVLGNQYRMTKLITGETELYNIVQDPHEWRNIATSHPDIVERLSKHLTFSVPKVADYAELEMEALPVQTSADYQRRGNFHYHQDSDRSSAGKQLVVEFRQKAGSYLDVVVEFEKRGNYDLQLEFGQQQENFELAVSYFRVANDALQASGAYPSIKAHPDTFSIDKSSAFSSLSNMQMSVQRPGNHIIRITTQSEHATQLVLDTLVIKKQAN